MDEFSTELSVENLLSPEAGPGNTGTSTEDEKGKQEPQLPQLKGETYASQLFWLTICFSLLYILMARSIVPRFHEVLEKRRHRIEQDLDRADALSREAEEAKKNYEQLHDESRRKAQEVLAETQASIKSFQEKELTKMDTQLTKKMSEAQAAITKKRDEVHERVLPAAAEVATAMIEKITGIRPNPDEIDTITRKMAKKA